MDCRTGRIYPGDMIQQLIRDKAITDQDRFKQMVIPPTPKQEERRRIGRNDFCPCGSGRKFKVCCLREKKDDRFKEED